MTPFDRLHPALQHHIVNSLGWKRLRPLQEQAIEPLLRGEHALLLAPTAGGKTEAAVFPVLSQMMHEHWRGLTVLYVCPLRALLNNLFVRIEDYGRQVGRRVALWHGDIGPGERRRIVSEPPDILLTTPESLEVILLSRQRDNEKFFAEVRVVIVDEIHAFAGDDRGWHLLSVLERVSHFAGRELQRIGLSATVGRPDDLLGWLAPAADRPRRVIAPPPEAVSEVDVTLDHVGSLDNAATVLAKLHAGEKRLVFCDSRSRVEDLAAALRKLGVETHVSHGSLGREERRRTEQAFSESSNCVIVATSTLELGIDIGDLDRVIQIDAPWRVASFLQRLGRTGRRPGTKRNCLFLTTTDDGFLRAAGILSLWAKGYVEPVVPPPVPFHIFAHQVMALTIQEGGSTRRSWEDWVGRIPAFRGMSQRETAAIVDYMLAETVLEEDAGILAIGRRGESEFGAMNFLEMFSVFTSEPLIAVRHGKTHLGSVDASTFAMRHEDVPVLLLAGRSWAATYMDWKDRIAYVEPVEQDGKSRWLGSGQPLHYELCQAIKAVLLGDEPGGRLSNRAKEQLAALRGEFSFLEAGRTTLATDASGVTWWTFGGLGANAPLAAALRRHGIEAAKPDNLRIRVENVSRGAAMANAIDAVRHEPAADMATPIDERAIDDLKFSVCLPERVAIDMLEERLTDRRGVAAVQTETVVRN